jgi:lipoprotein-anchoring transpeptidase ErfK/SrfK
MIRTGRTLALVVSCAVLLGAAPAAADDGTVRVPASGLVSSTAAVRAAPDPGSRAVRVLHRFGADGQFQLVLAIAMRRDGAGRPWYELSLPGRPNGQRGWVLGSLVDLTPAVNRIIVHVASRRLEVRRVESGHLLLSTVVAVGKHGAETPLGRDFFVQGRYLPNDPFFGPFVLVTTAYSKLSDWPGGGLAGIHGTDQPQLLGQAVSHGCVRVPNSVALALERLAPLGTPVDFLAN